MSQRRKKGLPPSLSSILAGTTTRGECRLWTGATSANGYPYVYDCREYKDGLADGKRVNGMRSARSVVWGLSHGSMPEGKSRVVLTCMDKCCLAPWHMLAMSHGEAASHAAQHGAYKTIRHRVAATVNSRKRAKLNPDKASLIRHRVQANNEDRQVVANSMDVSRSLVDQIIRGHRWKTAQMARNASVFHQVAWPDQVACSNDEAPIATAKAIAAVRKITIEGLRKVESEEKKLGATHSTFESVQATSGPDPLPTLIAFKCVPYLGLAERTFALRLSIQTGNATPGIVLRVVKHEQHAEEMAEELARLVRAAMGDIVYVLIGAYSAAS